MLEWIGGLLGHLPTWLILPSAIIIVFIGWGAYSWFIDGGDLFDRWWNRRKREKELNHGKK